VRYVYNIEQNLRVENLVDTPSGVAEYDFN